MLLPAEVRPFLSHEDGFVRDLALDYLGDANDRGPATQEDLWVTMDRYGEAPKEPKAERGRFGRALASFPPTERSTERLLEGLRMEVDQTVRRALVRAAAELPPEAVRRLLDDQRIVKRLSAEEVEGLRDDLDLAGKGADALASELRDHAARLEGTTIRPVGGTDVKEAPLVRRSERIVRAFARHPDRAADGALHVLRGLRHAGGVWEETHALMIFARLPLPSVEERVLDILDDETLATASIAAREALVRLGTPDVIRAIDERFAGRTARLYDIALSVVRRIKRPESEAMLLHRFTQVKGRDARTELARSLCELCTTSPVARAAIAEMVRTRSYNEMFATLDENSSALATMVGAVRG